MDNKRKLSLRRFIVIILSLVTVFFEPILIFSLSANSAKVYSQPKNINTVFDFKDYKYDGDIFTPFGDYEFYYNQLLRTDSIDEKDIIRDGTITMPNKWNGKKIIRNNTEHRLSGDGFATFRTTLKNLEPSSRINLQNKNYGNSIKVFFNGELSFSSGVLSKIQSMNNISPINSFTKTYIVPEDGNVIVDIEVGNSSYGGLPEVLVLKLKGSSNRFISINEAIIFFSVGLIATVFITSVLFLFSYKTDKKKFLLSAVTVLTLFLSVIFSNDGLDFFFRLNMYPNYYVFQAMHYVMTIFFFISLISLCKVSVGIEMKYLTFKRLIVVILSTIFIYFASQKTFLSNVATLLALIPLTYAYSLLLLQTKKNMSTENILYLFSFSISFGMIISDARFIYLPLMIRHMSRTALFSIILALVSIASYIYQYISLYKDTREREKVYAENVKLKEETLKQEIKPHYLFNTLSVIKHTYHQNIQEGDKMVALFSKSFRDSIDIMSKDLVPFERELEMVVQYLDLENARFKKKFDLILDIDFDDFMIPPLTIEPIVENSVKYSRVNEKEDGYIQISCHLDDNIVNIIIEDNGIGFDKSQVKSTSLGQNNLRERLKLHLDANVDVDSSIGKGCKTTITFELKENIK